MFTDNSDSLSTKCEVAITQLIQRGALRAGEKISEATLARRLRMGRAPVRAALDRLSQVGLVRRLSRSGTFVREVTLSQYCDMMDVRAVLEGLAIRVGCPHFTDKKLNELSAMASTFDKQNNEKRSGRRWFGRSIELDLRFHLELIHASKNSRVIQILEDQRLLEQTFFTALGLTPGVRNFPPDFPTHKMIVDALRQQDAEMAEHLIIRHIVQGKELAIRDSTRGLSSGNQPALKSIRDQTANGNNA